MQDNLQKNADKISLLFENSWEVCNKVGGIYTVLSTKARILGEVFADRLIFIGPDVWSSENPSPDFIERKTLLKSAASKMELPYGISIRVGRWNIPGNPLAVLVKYDGIYSELNGIFGQMWENFGVDSLHANGDYEESCAFAVASAIVMKALSAHLNVAEEKVITHFNEWTTGMGLLWIRLNMPSAATVFTAHATCIGRSICGNGKDLYQYFKGYNGDQMAAELNMESKHSLEKAAAHAADCFTAVSELTADECEQLLDIRPKVVTPNGFEPGFVPGERKYRSLRKAARKRIFEIASKLKGKHFDSDNTVIVATSGRNEYRNKGIDLFLDSLANADAACKGRSVLALVLVPAWASVISETFAGASGAPDFLSHRLNNELSDPTACRIRQLEMENRLGHDVDVIFIPVYLDGHDGVVDISYYDFLPAVDMTVFPSYYEPWGYTPLESVAFGVPTVTTDKSGFGRWILEDSSPGLSASGVDVVPRDDTGYVAAAEAIAADILAFASASDDTREEMARAALATAAKADWTFFIPRYYTAFADAMKHRDERI
ncbi:MAG: glycosyltransferase [Bacteroidales bacterium]|nr:glycosyltransferase [Bacteroidales bacterium]